MKISGHKKFASNERTHCIRELINRNSAREGDIMVVHNNGDEPSTLLVGFQCCISMDNSFPLKLDEEFTYTHVEIYREAELKLGKPSE